MAKIKLFLCALRVLLAAFLIYAFIIVIQARAKTPEIVGRALSTYNIQVELEELTKQEFEILLKVQDPNFFHHNGFDIRTPH
jgi:membrane carboxypeptidase/penicillin-binding protein PbpC